MQRLRDFCVRKAVAVIKSVGSTGGVERGFPCPLAPDAHEATGKLFWIYLTEQFWELSSGDFKTAEPAMRCELVPITFENAERVVEFRDPSRIADYRKKLARREIGFFAARPKNGGQLWATTNTGVSSVVARG